MYAQLWRSEAIKELHTKKPGLFKKKAYDLSGLDTHINDMKVRIGTDDAYYSPDLLVSCAPTDHKRNYIKQSPLLIIEILSSSAEAYDRGGKFAFYRQLTSIT